MIVEVLIPVTLIGFVIAGVLSAAMSMVDSLLLVAASSVVRDVYQGILSLFWARFTRRGALTAMISGFVAVPIFQVCDALAARRSRRGFCKP